MSLIAFSLVKEIVRGTSQSCSCGRRYRSQVIRLHVIDTRGHSHVRAMFHLLESGSLPPVLRRFADSLAPHQNLVRAKTAAELAKIEVIHVHGIAL